MLGFGVLSARVVGFWLWGLQFNSFPGSILSARLTLLEGAKVPGAFECLRV